MRVYLTTGKTVVNAKGNRTVYYGTHFYNVDDALGQLWVDEGCAEPATEKNEIDQTAKAKKDAAAAASEKADAEKRRLRRGGVHPEDKKGPPEDKQAKKGKKASEGEKG